jgi:hypothetical protein
MCLRIQVRKCAAVFGMHHLSCAIYYTSYIIFHSAWFDTNQPRSMLSAPLTITIGVPSSRENQTQWNAIGWSTEGTHHDWNDHSDTPRVKDVNEVLLDVTVDPTDGSEDDYDPIEEIFAQVLSVIVHDLFRVLVDVGESVAAAEWKYVCAVFSLQCEENAVSCCLLVLIRYVGCQV